MPIEFKKRNGSRVECFADGVLVASIDKNPLYSRYKWECYTVFGKKIIYKNCDCFSLAEAKKAIAFFIDKHLPEFKAENLGYFQVSKNRTIRLNQAV